VRAAGIGQRGRGGLSSRSDEVEAFLRGVVFDALAGVPYPRANPVDMDHLPSDVWSAATVPVGLRLEFVGDARVVGIGYETTSVDFGYRGEGAGCTFAAFRNGQKISEVEATLGEGVARLDLSGEPTKPVVVYVPEAMRPTIKWIAAEGGEIEPAMRQPRWLAYGDAVTQGWLASSPAMAWPAVAARKLGLDLCNMGFSGSARGETFSAVTLADTPAEAVSIAYGMNCWSRIPHTPGMLSEGLRAFITIVRSGHPDAPIVVVSPLMRPDAEDMPNRLGATLGDLRMAMEETVHEMVAAGDTHLHLVEGGQVVGEQDLADGVYPSDEGHKRIAAAVGKYLSPHMDAMRKAAAQRLVVDTMGEEAGVGSEGTAEATSGAAREASTVASWQQPQDGVRHIGDAAQQAGHAEADTRPSVSSQVAQPASYQEAPYQPASPQTPETVAAYPQGSYPQGSYPQGSYPQAPYQQASPQVPQAFPAPGGLPDGQAPYSPASGAPTAYPPPPPVAPSAYPPAQAQVAYQQHGASQGSPAGAVPPPPVVYPPVQAPRDLSGMPPPVPGTTKPRRVESNETYVRSSGR